MATTESPSLLVSGGKPIHGSIQLGGNKNAALPMIAAALLTDSPVILHNVPNIVDVTNMLAIAQALGVSVKQEQDTILLQADNLSSTELSAELCSRTRTSLLFAGPLAARLGKAHLHQPGGDSIGRRRIDGHLYGLRKLGIGCDFPAPGELLFQRSGSLQGTEIFLDEASVTATEHILLVAALSRGTTTLINAACEPHVTQLAKLLNAMGATIRGLESNILTIEGVPRLHGAEITIDADHIEAASFLSLCACTGGSVELTGAISPRTYWMLRRVFERFSLNFDLRSSAITMSRSQPPRVVCDAGGAIPCISDGTWPQFPSDMLSSMVIVATQAAGTTLFFEKMFESRLYFVDKLIAMGANAVVCDPHRVVVSGPTRLHGIEMSSPDIRAGMAMISAACCADGQSVIHNARMVFRGYSNLVKKMQTLGVDIRQL